MADNFEANAGSGGDTFAADEILSVKYPRSKIVIGADGVNDGDVSASNPLPVDVASSALPSGAATSAKQDTIIGHVDGIETLLAGGLPAALGAQGALKIEGVASGTAVPISVATIPSHAVTNAGTFAVQVDGNALTSLQLLDDVVFSDDAVFTAATSKVAAVGGIVTADSVDAGDIGAFAMLANRQQKVTLYDSSGVELSVGGGTQYTEDAAAAANPVGNAIILVREDARAGGLTTTDGDNVAMRGNNKGEAYVKDTDAGALLGTIDADTGNIATSVQLLDDTVFAEDVAASAADKGIAILAVRRDADTTLVDTTNDYANLQVDANGFLKVEIFDGGNSHTVDNNGTFVTQIDGNALTALQLIDDPVVQDDAGFTPGTTKVMMAGFEADETATDSVDEGDGGAARMTLDRKVITTPQPHTGGGLLIARDIDLDNSTLTVVKNAAGQLYGWTITNTSTATVFVKFYDATSGTLGTGTPVLTIGIPGNATDDTLATQMFPYGVIFSTGICVGAGTGVADNDNTDPGANAVVANIFYK